MKRLLTLSLLLVSLSLYGGDIRGRVFSGDKKNDPISGALIYWAEGGNSSLSKSDGNFEIFKPVGAKTLIATILGHKSDTIFVDNNSEVIFNLSPSLLEVEEVKVTSKRSNIISKIAIDKKELITFAGLCKMACCSVAESFENSASVTVGYSDAVSGARQIKLLGYGGCYTQMLDSARPIMRGLGSTFGLEHTPGMWLKGIQISKGVSSVVNGYEALTGQINLEHRKPTDPDRLFVNLFLSDELRSEANITTSLPINDRLSTTILTHFSIDPLKSDHNGDGFMDMPQKKQYNVANRWLYQTPYGVQLRYGAQFLYEERKGGEIDFTEADRATQNSYGTEIDNRNFNGYIKLGIPVIKNRLSEDDPLYDLQTTSSFAIVADYVNYSQNSFFGLKEYNGEQNSAFTNILYQIDYGKSHKLILGANFTADLYKERLEDSFTTGKNSSGEYNVATNTHNFDRDEFVVGALGEYTYRYGDKFSAVAGFRADYHNIYGWMLTPRSHIKWDLTPSTTLRGSAGVGYRAMSLITDNIGALATGREIVFEENLNPLEKGITAGVSLTQTFNLFKSLPASVSVEYFRTQFSNQVVVDQEYNSNQLLFYNLVGDSYTNTYQIDFSLEPFSRFNIFATYRYNDCFTTLKNQGKVQTPLVDKFKGLVNLQYATKFDKWTFDFTAQLNGQSRIPVQDGSMVENSSYSPIYPMFFAQITKKVRFVDIYLGCENIGNYRQSEPIISAADPFSNNFNSTLVWGPMMGRKFYIGMRYTLTRY